MSRPVYLKHIDKKIQLNRGTDLAFWAKCLCLPKFSGKPFVWTYLQTWVWRKLLKGANLPPGNGEGGAPSYFFAQRLYSGIFPCFLAGFFSRFVASISSAAFSRRRVSLGRITASM